jgi:protein SCO1/2
MVLWTRRFRDRRREAIFVIVLAIIVGGAGCSRAAPREYKLEGQILAVNRERQEVTIRHGDIAGFMPGMTMAFKVRDLTLLDGRTPGDMVSAVLVVEEADAHLRALDRTGHAPVPAGEMLPMHIVSPGEPVADARLVDQTGTPRQLADWRGQVLAVTFIYTRCPLPNFCPLMDRHFASVQDAIAADADLRGQVRLVSVSFDPAQDTPTVLARHASAVKADPAVWSFLTGENQDVEAFASQFGVSVMRDEPDAQEIVHNLRTAVIDGQGQLVTILNGSEWAPSDLVAALKQAHAKR